MSFVKPIAQNQMSVTVRPEIRKGCVWGLQFKFSPEICAKMTEFTTTEVYNPINNSFEDV
jgi:hypothetical protein